MMHGQKNINLKMTSIYLPKIVMIRYWTTNIEQSVKL